MSLVPFSLPSWGRRESTAAARPRSLSAVDEGNGAVDVSLVKVGSPSIKITPSVSVREEAVEIAERASASTVAPEGNQPHSESRLMPAREEADKSFDKDPLR